MLENTRLVVDNLYIYVTRYDRLVGIVFIGDIYNDLTCICTMHSTTVGTYQTEPCSLSTGETGHNCTVVSGQIKWAREMGGAYCCSSNVKDWYYIYWINPGNMSMRYI